MPQGTSITSANAIFALTIAGPAIGTNLYAGVQLQQFGVDNAFMADTVDTAEIEVGVDGYGVAGYRPHEVPMTIRFEAASPSIIVFENWYGAQDAIGDILFASAIIWQPSIGRKYLCPMGTLMRVQTMAEVRRILADREFNIHWLPNGPGQPAISAGPI